MNKVAENWDTILNKLKTEYDITEVAFNTWLKPLKVYDDNLADNMVTLLAPFERKDFIKVIENKYKLYLQVTIAELLGMECDIRFISEKDVPAASTESVSDSSSSEQRLIEKRCEEANLNAKYTFDTFIVGKNNSFAHAASLAVAEAPGEIYNPLFIYGGAGLGKTHLMHSIARYIIEHNRNSKVLYVTSEQFTSELIDAIRNGSNTRINNFREKYRKIDVLLVDDIQFIIGKDSTQEEFFNTFNELHLNKKHIVISSDKPPKEMKILEERFRSRFEMGLITEINAPDYETRMAILHKKEETEGYNIREEVIQYIATNVKSNIRELEGAFNAVTAYSRLENKEITMELAENALKNFISPNETRTITTEYIISVVAEHFHLTVADLVSKKRNNTLVTPRHIAIYLCRELIDNSNNTFTSIGKVLGRDHSTIMNGYDKIKAKMESDENMKNTIDILKKKINPQE